MEIFDSLENQFKEIQRILEARSIYIDTLEQFVRSCLPPFENQFYVSLPAFTREIQEARTARDSDYISNIVIRPERTVSMNQCIPPEKEILFIGDIVFRSTVKAFVVKGIEFLDSSVARFGERAVRCVPALAFSQIRLNNGVTVPDYGIRDLRDSVLTEDMILSLCEEVYPVPEPEKALRQFEEWEQYLNFREYYLQQKSERSFPVNEAHASTVYLIKGRDYLDHEDELKDHRLPGDTRKVKHSDNVLIDIEVPYAETETVPVVTVICRKNRLALQQDVVNLRNGRTVPVFEKDLFAFTREYVAVTRENDRYDSGILFEERLITPCQLEIEPDCTVLQQEYSHQQEKKRQEITMKFTTLIESELSKYRTVRKQELKIQAEQEIDEYHETCLRETERKRSQGGIPEVEKLYEDDCRKIRKSVKEKYQKQLENLEKSVSELTKKEKTFQTKLKKKQKANDAEQNQAIEEKLTEIRNHLLEARENLAQMEQTIREETEQQTAGMSIDAYYSARIDSLVNQFAEQEKKKCERLLEEDCQNYGTNLEVQYQPEMKQEIQETLQKIADEKDRAVQKKIREETEIHYYIYFRLDHTMSVDSAERILSKNPEPVLCYNTRADEAKLNRQRNALASLRAGYVKNPFLAAYLFSPSHLPNADAPKSEQMQWYLESLNQKQKEAVCRALASDSLFLLQGPPGTGKTQVIAEIAAHLAKSGKKVLISSETHKAIDNVFERLPKIPEIRPVRLMNASGRKKTDYAIKDLLDNFYRNISDGLRKQIRRYDNFQEYQENFNESMLKLQGLHQKMLSLEEAYNAAKDKKEEHERRLTELASQSTETEEKLAEELTKLHDCKEYRRYLEQFRISEKEMDTVDEAYQNTLKGYRLELEQLLMKYPEFIYDVSHLPEISVFSAEEAEQQIHMMALGNPEITRLNSQKLGIKKQMESLCDPDTEEPLPEFEDQYNELRKEFRQVAKEIKRLKSEEESGSHAGFEDLAISKLFTSTALADNANRELPGLLNQIQQEICAIQENYLKFADSQLRKYETACEELRTQKNELSRQRETLREMIRDLESDQAAQEYTDAVALLKAQIRAFFLDFEIRREYRADNIQDSLRVLQEEWQQMAENYQRQKEENAVKIPMYQNIVKFLSQPSDEEEKAEYIPMLFENVNIFGMTCTSRDYFSAKSLDGAEEYGIEELNMRYMGIDVVIVDEVSKSAFLDLLIPILYGKTVILVGDHRQLPPMYDLKHLRREDFDELDPYYITYEQNKNYTQMFETCYFKTLFEQVPDSCRIMLNQQYRCHSEIMDIFNYFYGGNGLSLGMANQNDMKQHDLTIRIGGRNVIVPSKHTYFIDCEKPENRVGESSSVQNEQEASVIVELLNQIDRAAGERGRQMNQRTGKNKIPALSAGVICTYGDQAGLIERKIGKKQMKNLSSEQGERFIISTVDDFQGDERDIILVSMVRNHDGEGTSKFLQQFERINVAFSRARTLLIIVGSKEFLSRNSIYLPDINGMKERDKKNYFIYREIIQTIRNRGGFLTADMILPE